MVVKNQHPERGGAKSQDPILPFLTYTSSSAGFRAGPLKRLSVFLQDPVCFLCCAPQKQTLRQGSMWKRFIEEMIPGGTSDGAERGRMGKRNEPGQDDSLGKVSSSTPTKRTQFVPMQGKRAGLSHFCTSHPLALLAYSVS